MLIENQIPLLDNILADYKEAFGSDYQGYRNHVCRVINFCFALQTCTEEERQKIIIAGAFHDIGIWIEDTLDYIPPSVPKAKEYLLARGLQAWNEEITLMITEHHKLRECKNEQYPLVELFRKGDLVDFSLGMVNFGLPKTFIQDVNTIFPNADFHQNLAKRAAKWGLKHPLDPVPMVKL